MADAERVLAQIESVVGATADSFLGVGKVEGVSLGCCIFEDRPHAGVRTLVSFGLSHLHPHGGDEHVELLLEIGSKNDVWALALAECAAQVSKLAMREGDLFTVGQPFIPAESQLSGFAIAAPLRTFARIKADSRLIALRQLIPLFPGEYAHAKKVGGLAALNEYRRRASFEPWNVRRPDCSSQ